jgi:hypothetical protein
MQRESYMEKIYSFKAIKPKFMIFFIHTFFGGSGWGGVRWSESYCRSFCYFISIQIWVSQSCFVDCSLFVIVDRPRRSIITKPKEIINLRNDPWSKTIIIIIRMCTISCTFCQIVINIALYYCLLFINKSVIWCVINVILKSCL